MLKHLRNIFFGHNKKLSAIFVIASFWLFMMGLQIISKGVSLNITYLVFVYFILVVIGQILLINLIFNLARSEIVRCIVMGLFLGANSVSFYVSFYQKFVSLSKITIVVLTLIISGLASVLIYAILRSPKLLKIAGLIVSVNILFLGISTITYQPVEDTAKPGISYEKYKSIEFKQKPNIHFITFDSMSPASLIDKHLGIKDLPYIKYLAGEAHIYSNFFVSDSPSKPSLNSIMRLGDQDIAGEGFFSGRSESPVSDILQSNGYSISTGYSDDDFFGNKGPYIQEFNSLRTPKTVSSSTLCNYSTKKEKIIQFYGICMLIPKVVKQPVENTEWYQDVFDLIGQKADDSKPWFTFNYIYRPIGHTPKSINSKDKAQIERYAGEYSQNSTKLANILPDLVDTIKKKDPNSIVFIFGDHGPWLTRSLEYKDDPEYVVTDRYGAFGSILNTKNSCSGDQVNYYQKSYMTPERVFAGIFRCLAKDPQKVDNIVNFKESYKFEDFLYE